MNSFSTTSAGCASATEAEPSAAARVSDADADMIFFGNHGPKDSLGTLAGRPPVTMPSAELEMIGPTAIGSLLYERLY